MPRKALALAVTAAVLLGAGIVVGMLLDNDSGDGGATTTSAPATATAIEAPLSATAGPATIAADCLTAAEIYEDLRPSVVEVVTQAARVAPLGLPQGGQGSGVIIDADGAILTNEHVIDGADAIEVRFADGSTAEAEIAGRDPGNDLAIIRADVPAGSLPAAPLGSSASLRVGDPVLAIGNPFSLEGTLTQGIVSSLGRTFAVGGDTRPIRDMIQTDAPVNPGNSGGPLINCRGEVIGINTLLENPTGDNVNVGIAFAVAIDTVRRSLPDMLADATVQHPWLGIGGREVTPALSNELGLSTDRGVYITVVAADSPAEEAGLRGAFGSETEAAQGTSIPPGGDVIIRVDGRPVESVEELAGYLDQNKAPGDTVELLVSRDGEELSVQATLVEWPS